MNITVREANGIPIAVVDSDPGEVATVQDALDLLATVNYVHSSTHIVLPAASMSPDFFDLRTGIAGEILQKFTNYGVRAAFVGDFSGYTSKALADFIRESNRGNGMLFVDSIDAAIEALSK